MTRHRHRFRVRYGETDQMGFVHHSVYTLYFEEGRTGLMRDLGMPYSELERSGVVLPVTDLGIRFRTPAKYDEELEVEARVTRVTGVRVRFDYRVFHADGSLVAEGHTVLGSIDGTGRPVRLPAEVVGALRGAIEDGAEEAGAEGVQAGDPGRPSA